jgi:glycosyltransferase involved in cell wall biosynthesis
MNIFNAENPFLSVIIPAFNEHHTISPLLTILFRQPISVTYEVIIVDDGSEPPLKPLIVPFQKIFPNLYLYRQTPNSGKGSAIQIGIQHARGQYIIIQDADLEYHPKDIPELIQPVLNSPKTPKLAVFGSRFHRYSHQMTKVHHWGNLVITHVANLFFRLNLTDVETGYKLIPRELFDQNIFSSKGFDIEIELTSNLIRAGYEIREVPISYNYRSKGNAKVTILDGLEAVILLILFRYFAKNHFFLKNYRWYRAWVKPKLTRCIRFFFPASPRLK